MRKRDKILSSYRPFIQGEEKGLKMGSREICKYDATSSCRVARPAAKAKRVL